MLKGYGPNSLLLEALIILHTVPPFDYSPRTSPAEAKLALRTLENLEQLRIRRR